MIVATLHESLLHPCFRCRNMFISTVLESFVLDSEFPATMEEIQDAEARYKEKRPLMVLWKAVLAAWMASLFYNQAASGC